MVLFWLPRVELTLHIYSVIAPSVVMLFNPKLREELFTAGLVILYPLASSNSMLSTIRLNSIEHFKILSSTEKFISRSVYQIYIFI